MTRKTTYCKHTRSRHRPSASFTQRSGQVSFLSFQVSQNVQLSLFFKRSTPPSSCQPDFTSANGYTTKKKESNVDNVPMPMVWRSVLQRVSSANMVEIRFIRKYFVAAHMSRESSCAQSVTRSLSVVVYGKNSTRLDCVNRWVCGTVEAQRCSSHGKRSEY